MRQSLMPDVLFSRAEPVDSALPRSESFQIMDETQQK